MHDLTSSNRAKMDSGPTICRETIFRPVIDPGHVRGELAEAVVSFPGVWPGLEPVVLTGSAVIGTDTRGHHNISERRVPQRTRDSNEQDCSRFELLDCPLGQYSRWLVPLAGQGERYPAVRATQGADFKSSSAFMHARLSIDQPAPYCFVLEVQGGKDHHGVLGHCAP